MKISIIGLLCVALSIKSYAITESKTIEGAVGNLSVIIEKPILKEGEKCPMVILLHGFMGNKNGALEQSMANALSLVGMASIRFDFNGHGDSEGKFEHMTVPNEIEDAKLVYVYARSLRFVDKIALCGHSQGGVVAAMMGGQLGADSLSAIVLMAPAAVLRDDAIRGNTMGTRYNALDPPETVELFNGKKLGRSYIKTAFWLPIYETAEKYKGAACIIHGTADNIVPFTYGERFHSIWPNSEWHLLEGADHGFSGDIEEATGIAVSFLIKQLK